ncbi:MAG: ABC transporter permease [Clostridium sp.]
MKLIFRFRKRDSYIVIMFFIIILTFSICTSIIYSEVNKINNQNGVGASGEKYFNFKNPEKVTTSQIVDIVSRSNTVYLEYNPIPIVRDITTNFGKAIYSKNSKISHPPVLEGRFFTEKELSSNEDKIVIGSSLKKYIEKSGKFKVENREYTIIGIIGDNTGKSAYEEMFILPMKSINIKSDIRSQWKITGDKNKVNSILKEINTAYDIVEKQAIYKVNIKEIIKDMGFFINIFLVSCLIGILNIILIIQFWVGGYSKEIGLRKALGATNIRVIYEVFIKYQLILGVSFILALIAHYSLQGLLNNMLNYVNVEFSISNSIIVYLASMIVGIVVGIIPIIKTVIVKPSISMKGTK